MKLSTALFLMLASVVCGASVMFAPDHTAQLAAWSSPQAAVSSPARAALDAAVPGAGAQWTDFAQGTRDMAARAAIAAREADGTIAPAPAESRQLILCTNHAVEVNSPVDGLLIENKHFKAAPGTEGVFDGLRVIADCKNITVRNCVFEGFKVGINLSPLEGRRAVNVVIDQCIVIDSFGGQGLYAHSVDGLRVMQSLFDQCGWHPGHPEQRTNFDHCAYVNNGCTGVSFSECWFGNPASYGIELRCGGVLEGCVVIGAVNGIREGGGGDSFPEEVGGVLVDLQDCLIAGRAAPPHVDKEGMLTLSNVGLGKVSRLVIAGPAEALDGWSGWSVLVAGDRGVVLGTDLHVETCGWTGAFIKVDGVDAALAGSQFTESTHPLGLDLPKYEAMLLRARERQEPWDDTYSPRRAIEAARAELGLEP